VKTLRLWQWRSGLDFHEIFHSISSELWACQKIKYSAKKKGIQCKFRNFLNIYFSNFLIFLISKCDLRTWLHNFSCILLSCNLKNIHSWVFQRLQIALVLRTRAILIVFENSLVHVFPNIILVNLLDSDWLKMPIKH
jgi:hypothetical protein